LKHTALTYKKFYTPIKETLEDDYPDLNPKLISSGDKNNIGLKLISTIKSPNGLKVKTTYGRDPNANYNVLCEPELKITKYNLSYEGKMGTDRKFQHTLNYLDLFGKGSKVYGKAISEEGKLSGEAGFEYKDSNLTLSGSVTKPQDGEFRALGTGVYKHSDYNFGGDVEYDHEHGITRYSAKVQHDKNDSTLCVFLNNIKVPKKKGDSPKLDLGFGYYQKIRGDLKGALDFKVDNKLETEIRFGSDYQVNDTTSVKSKVSLKRTAMRLGLSLKQKLTPSSKVILSTDLDTKSLFGTGEKESNDHRFWVTFSFGDD